MGHSQIALFSGRLGSDKYLCRHSSVASTDYRLHGHLHWRVCSFAPCQSHSRNDVDIHRTRYIR